MDLPADIHLYTAALPAQAPLPLAALSVAEQEQAAAFGSERRRRTFVLGRATARRLLAAQLDLAPAEVPLQVAPDGAPGVPASPWQVSIAHTITEAQVLAAAAVAARPVGVDLEWIRPRRPDLYRYILHPDEYGLLEQLPFGHDAAQVLLWALKEATLKALRTGFRLSPKKLRLTVEPERQAATVRMEDGTTWTLRYDEHDGCFLAVAFQAA